MKKAVGEKGVWKIMTLRNKQVNEGAVQFDLFCARGLC